MLDDPQEQLADATRVQSLFREVNERVREVVSPGERVQYLCECGDRLCSREIVLSAEEYDSVRRFPSRFFVYPGHQSLDDERVLEWNERYAVVEKFGESGRVAVRLDPRRRQLLADLTDPSC
jgi:hypothetical protein